MCETLSQYEFSKYLNFQIIDYYNIITLERERAGAGGGKKGGRERERERIKVMKLF